MLINSIASRQDEFYAFRQRQTAFSINLHYLSNRMPDKKAADYTGKRFSCI